jgi:hypothetical protein
MVRAATFALALLFASGDGRSQSAEAVTQATAGQPRSRVPFGVGELLEYDIRVAIARGNARLEIVSLDTVRGRPAWHAISTTRGGIRFLSVNDRYDSWIDTNTISTLRYREDVDEGTYERRRNYEFYPEVRRYIEGRDTVTTVDRPVDQTSIFYLIRTMDLRVGLDTSFHNYFMIDRNPIRIIVLGRERITVPAGTFDAIVVRPIIKAKGMFAEGGDARVWISDDDRRIVLQVKAKVPKLPLGAMNMYLRTYRPPLSNRPPGSP